MTTFYICRHGQTENNRNGRLSGWIDTPLTGDGVLHAIESAGKLKGLQFDQVISSDLGRAFRTAYIITQELGINLYIDTTPGLREVNYGDFANRSYTDSVLFPGLTPEEGANYVPPNGESLAQMKERVIQCVRNIAKANPDKTILLVAHDGTINAVRSAFSGNNVGVIDSQQLNDHSFVGKFRVDSGKITSFEEVK
jgi:broad specificity phosphatase PhoE